MKSIIKTVIIILFLSTSIAIATETTWRHSGFEITGYDINGSSTYNITEIRKIEFGWNSSIPSVSESNRAVMYYDNNEKKIKYSIDGGAYNAIVANGTVEYFTGDGITINFTVQQTVSSTTSRVYINGLRQREGALGSYVEHSTFIEFASAPPLYDSIEVEYV